MTPTLTVLNAVLPVFLLVAAGVALRKRNWLTEEADASLLRVLMNLLLPCLSFDSIAKNEALRHPGNLIVAPLVGFGTLALGFAAAWAVRRWAGLRNNAEQRTFVFTVGVYNWGYVPIPLAMMLFDPDTVGILFVHNVGVETGLWTLGLLLLGDKTWRRDWRKIFNPPLLAILLAATLNLTRTSDAMPAALAQTVHMLGQCAIPMGLVLIGAIMADHLASFHEDFRWRVMAWAAVLRLGVLPLAFLALAKFLPVPVELKRVIILQAAMPCATFPIAMAKHYSGDPPTALRIVLATSLLAFATIPMWIKWGLKWVIP